MNEKHGLQPGGKLVVWVVELRTGRDASEVPEDEKRRVVADEQMATFLAAEEIAAFVLEWRLN